MREVIGRTPIQPALTELRAQIENDVLHQTQQILDNYKAGVEITQVQLQKVDPPAEVVESFRRRAARQHRRRTPAQRGRGLSQRHRAARPRRCGAHRGGRAGRPAGLDRRGDRADAALPFGAGGLSDGEGRDAAAHVPRDDAGHPDPLAVGCGGRQAEGAGAVPAAQSAGAGSATAATTPGGAPSTAASPDHPRRHPGEHHDEPRRDRRHRRPGGAVRAGGGDAVHGRSDRAGAGHPVRPAGPGDRAAGTARQDARSSRR